MISTPGYTAQALLHQDCNAAGPVTGPLIILLGTPSASFELRVSLPSMVCLVRLMSSNILDTTEDCPGGGYTGVTL